MAKNNSKKNNANESDAPKKWILVPVFGDSEKNPEFLDQLKDATRIVLLFVVDKDSMQAIPTGFIGTRIKVGEETLEEIKRKLPNTIEVKDYVEWGNWLQKIENVALLEHVDEIVMSKDNRTRKIAEKLEGRDLKLRLI